MESTHPVGIVSCSNAIVASVAAIWVNVNTGPQRDRDKDEMITDAGRHINDDDD